MIRATTYLTKPLYDDVQHLADQAGKPAADVLRDLVERGLRARRQEFQPAPGSGLLELANLHITGGPKDLSTKADHYLYGDA